MYLEKETRIPGISDVMSQKLRDKGQKDLEENKRNKLFKIAPILFVGTVY